MNIDWSKAPEGATHWDPGLNGRVAGWMKIEDGIWYWWPVEEAYSCPKKWHASLNQHKVNTVGFIERPILWNGEGLPPVGIKIEMSHKQAQPDWANPGFRETKIVAMGEQLMILEADGSGHEKVAKIADYHFRPIHTAEQIAAEEREKACRQICLDAGSPEQTPGQMGTAYRLYDAGYRKQVTK